MARTLVPYISDAVPGWFQAAITVYDENKNEVAYKSDFMFNPDPITCVEIPSDGKYYLEIKDALYRGREDFVYRILLGEILLITSVYPLGGKSGVSQKLNLCGWNLPFNIVEKNSLAME